MTPFGAALRTGRGRLAAPAAALALATGLAALLHGGVAAAASTGTGRSGSALSSVTTGVGPSVRPKDLLARGVPAVLPVRVVRPAHAVRAAHLISAPADVCSGPGWEYRRGQQALAMLRDDGARSGVTVSFSAARAGYLGLTFPAQHHVEVFVRSCAQESAALLRHVVSHEMGHAYDAAHMTPALRAAYLAIRGIPAGTPWFGCSYCTDFATPAGDFAETYSQWQRGLSDSRTQIAPIPSPAQLAAIATAFFGA